MNKIKKCQRPKNVSEKPPIIKILIAAAALIICAAAIAAILKPYVQLKIYLSGNADVHYALLTGKVRDSYYPSAEDETYISEGLKLYYDENPSHYICSDIEFDTEYKIITHVVFTCEITDEIISSSSVNKRYRGETYRITVDVPQKKNWDDLTQDDMKFNIEKVTFEETDTENTELNNQ